MITVRFETGCPLCRAGEPCCDREVMTPDCGFGDVELELGYEDGEPRTWHYPGSGPRAWVREVSDPTPCHHTADQVKRRLERDEEALVDLAIEHLEGARR